VRIELLDGCSDSCGATLIGPLDSPALELLDFNLSKEFDACTVF